MPTIKIHICSIEAPGNKALLARRLRELMVEKLQIDEKTGQVLLYETQPQYRSIHSDRSSNFAFMEVLLYSGRTEEMKEDLMISLAEEVHRILKIDIKDINCCLMEVPQYNWLSGINNVRQKK